MTAPTSSDHLHRMQGSAKSSPRGESIGFQIERQQQLPFRQRTTAACDPIQLERLQGPNDCCKDAHSLPCQLHRLLLLWQPDQAKTAAQEHPRPKECRTAVPSLAASHCGVMRIANQMPGLLAAFEEQEHAHSIGCWLELRQATNTWRDELHQPASSEQRPLHPCTHPVRRQGEGCDTGELRPWAMLLLKPPMEHLQNQ